MMTPISRFLRALFLYLCTATTAVAQQLSAPEAQPGTITGTVLDFRGDVVSQATVVLQGPNRDDVRSIAAQENGSFKFDSVNAGIPYHLSVSAKGFANWTSNEVILAPGQYLILTGINLRLAVVEVTVTVVPSEELAAQQVKAQVQQRIAGVLPNF